MLSFYLSFSSFSFVSPCLSQPQPTAVRLLWAVVCSTSYSSTPAADSVQAKIPATHPDQFYHHHCRVGWLTTTHPDQFYHHHCRVGWITATHPDQFYHQHCRVGWITATHPDKFYHQHCRVRWITVFRRLPLTKKSCVLAVQTITFTLHLLYSIDDSKQIKNSFLSPKLAKMQKCNWGSSLWKTRYK